MRICLLASGSKGNCLYVEAAGSRVLVDAGLSATETILRLHGIGVNASDIDAILLTHEHNDHVRGVGALARKLKKPVFASSETARLLEKNLKKVELVEFEAGNSFEFQDVLLDPFSITHDAGDPVGFVIDSAEGKIGVATDLGIATRLVREKLKGSRVLVLESNHDEGMLLNGPYPWHLKQRIKSRHGHLSNNDAADLLDELLHENLDALFLAHLSETNNHPDLVVETVTRLIASRNICNPKLYIGAPACCTDLYTT